MMATISAILLLLCTSVFVSVKAHHPCNSLDDKQSSSTTTPEQELVLQQLLLAGFRKNELNAYNLRGRFGFTSTGGTERCIVVRYFIQQTECKDTNETCTNDFLSNKCKINATEWAFLWSSFDTQLGIGKILLELVIFDLRVFGFELCDVYQDLVDVTIVLNSSDPEIATKSWHCKSICNVLLYFTTLVSTLW